MNVNRDGDRFRGIVLFVVRFVRLSFLRNRVKSYCLQNIIFVGVEQVEKKTV